MSKRRVTDEALERLGASVSKLVELFTFELREMNERLESLERDQVALEAVVAPGLAAKYEDYATKDESPDDLGEPRSDADITAPERVYKEVAPNTFKDITSEQSLVSAWEVTSSGARVYSAGGVTAQDTLNALLQAMVAGGDTDPSVLSIHIGFAGTDPGFESEGGFDGLLTVGI